MGLSCIFGYCLRLQRRAISLFDLLRYMQYETFVSLIVRFARCVGEEVAKNGRSEQNKKTTLLFRTCLVLLRLREKALFYI